MKELTLEITDCCSLNCIMCSTMAGKDGRTFISPEQVREWLDKYSDFEKIRLSGGEPFEHPDLERIVDVCSERKLEVLSCGVYHNSGISLEVFQKVRSIEEIVFSFHGYLHAHEDIVSGGKDWQEHGPYWDYLMDSTDNARLAEINYSFESVLLRKNFDKMEEMGWLLDCSARATNRKLKWHILRFVKQGRGEMYKDESLTESEIEDFRKLFEKMKREYHNLDISFSNSFLKDECDCGSRKAVVSVYGEEIPCSALKYGGGKGKFACRKRL